MDSQARTGRRGPPPTKHIDILWAATRLFARQGVAQTSTRQIAAEAATTERTLFKHFGSKEALLHAVIEQAVLPHLAPTSLEALRQVIDDFGGDFTVWHRALLEGRSASMAMAPELSRLLLAEILRDETLLKRFSNEWLPAVWEPLLGLFRRLQLEGRVAPHLQPEAVARMFLSLNLGYLIARNLLAPEYAWDDRSERQAIAALFADGTGLGAASKRSRG